MLVHLDQPILVALLVYRAQVHILSQGTLLFPYSKVFTNYPYYF